MDPIQIPDLPNLLTRQEFEQTSRAWLALGGRSAAIRQIATQIDDYHATRQKYQRARAEHLSQPSQQSYEQLKRTFAEAAKIFKDARIAHNSVEIFVSDWGPNAHPRRGDTPGVQRLWQQLQEASVQIDAGTRTLQAASMSLGGEPYAPKVNHHIWVGSVPPLAVVNNAEQWRNNGYEVNLWTDQRNLLNNHYRNETARMRTSESQQDPAIAARHLLWDNATDQERRDGFDARLVAQQPSLQKQLDEARQHLAALQKIDGVRIRDVSELFDPQSPPGGTGALSPQNRKDLKLAYQREMGLRFNLAAGSDLLRPAILHDHPGIYTDYDVAPPVKGMPHLINTWNGVVAQKLNSLQQGGRNERLATTTPDYILIERQRRKLDRTKELTPEPIAPTEGNTKYLHEPYEYLQRAVEEHLAELRTGILSDGTHYRALGEYARPYDPERRMMGAFDQWKNNTVRLSDAFEPIPNLHVPANSFRALSTSGTSANSNAVLASSTEGATHLADYQRQLVDNTNQMYANRESQDPEQQDKYQSYMNDSVTNAPKYKEQTMRTTGPIAMSKFLDDTPKDTSRQLPHSYLGNFTSDEGKSTWVPKQPEVPQQRGEGSRQSNAASREQPQNRVPRQPREEHTTEKQKGLGKISRK